MKKTYLLVDYDKTLSGMSHDGSTVWIQPTLNYIEQKAKSGVEPIIFTSMDSSNLKQDILDQITFDETNRAADQQKFKRELVTRSAGVAKLTEICVNPKLPKPQIKVMTPHDALSIAPIGKSYETFHAPTYRKYEENFDAQKYKINFDALKNDPSYYQFIRDECYLTRVDSILSSFLKNTGGAIASFTVNSFEPIKLMAEALCQDPNKDDKIKAIKEKIDRITRNKKDGDNDARHQLEELKNLVKENIPDPKVGHIVELMLIQSMSDVNQMKSAFEKFLDDHKEIDYVNTSQQLYESIQGAGPFEHSEKFSMSLHVFSEITKSASPGDIIDIEYLDDKKECLDEMLAAQEFFMKKCDKPILLRVKTVEVASIKAGEYKHKDYKEIVKFTEDPKDPEDNNKKMILLQAIEARFQEIKNHPAYPQSKAAIFFSSSKFSKEQFVEIKQLKLTFIAVLKNIFPEDRLNQKVFDLVNDRNSIVNFHRKIPVFEATNTRLAADELLNAAEKFRPHS